MSKFKPFLTTFLVVVVALVVINFAKPYLPLSVRKLVGA